ncbi:MULTISPECIES: hypothetical protein [unclassified Pseudactinotalea]|uniref:hypothetical protein n=1 Tax=unclassified Pseudactinotalea TaxID=2649176 RepID=UPI00128DB1BF|nr:MULTISPECIES: hypothetical protein [unclassified Pseudactinotalea]MPV51391.1 hypothetical protein [Pseudactinotalea sp. HY160]QGH70665.1 hypothetical protein GCE65_15060 [Pseudactinotalea sp. HY158]
MRRSSSATLGLGILCLALMAGCSDDGSATSDPSSEQTVGAEGTTSEPTPDESPDSADGAKPDTVVDLEEQPGSQEGYVGALGDAELATCATRDGALEVTGDVTNPQKEAQSYRIYVSAMQGSDTRGLTQVDVSAVGPGETASWEARLDLTDDDLTCVLRVERFVP